MSAKLSQLQMGNVDGILIKRFHSMAFKTFAKIEQYFVLPNLCRIWRLVNPVALIARFAEREI